jgi:FMN phosphatase YigB (HAD superfamily)
MENIECILFDLDKCFYQAPTFLKNYDAAIEEVCQRSGYQRAQLVATYRTTFSGVQALFGEQEFEKFVGAVEERYLGTKSDLRQQPALIREIQAVRAENVSVAILSNSLHRHVDRVLEIVLGEEHASLIPPSCRFGVDDVGFIGKPADRPFTQALQALKVTADRVLFVDDRTENLEMACHLGMGTVLVDQQIQPPGQGWPLQASSAAEVLAQREMLDRLQGKDLATMTSSALEKVLALKDR